MGKRRAFELMILLALVACGTALWPRAPVESTRPNVNGVNLGMRLHQAQARLPGYRAIQTKDSRWVLQGEGPYPDLVILDLPIIFDNDDYQIGVKKHAWAVTGTELSVEGHHLSAGSEESLARWLKQFPTHRTEAGLMLWEFPDFVAWARFATPEAKAPINVGLHQYNKRLPRLLDPAPTSELPVRPRGLLTRELVTVDGVSVGMSEEEVRKVLGEPLQVDGFGGRRELAYLMHGDPGPRTSIRLERGFVRFIEGPTLEFKGRILAPPGGSLAPLFEAFGRADDIHARGFGGTTSPCWSNDEVVIEVLPDFEEGETLQQVYVLDPRGQQRRHLWDTSCGTL